jgi:hypothetical protein
MSILHNSNLADAPDHPVLSEPYSYSVVAYSYEVVEPPYGTLHLTLEKDGSKVELCFSGVHELQIDAGFPFTYMGLEILDITYLGWEHARVRVEGYEDAPGIRFWARAVERVAG